MNNKTLLNYFVLGVTSWTLAVTFGYYVANKNSKSDRLADADHQLIPTKISSNAVAKSKQLTLQERIQKSVGNIDGSLSLLDEFQNEDQRLEVAHAIGLANASSHPNIAIKLCSAQFPHLLTDEVLLTQILSSSNITWHDKLELVQKIPKGGVRLSMGEVLACQVAKMKPKARMESYLALMNSTTLSDFEKQNIKRQISVSLLAKPNEAITFFEQSGHGNIDKDFGIYRKAAFEIGSKAKNHDFLTDLSKVENPLIREIYFNGWIDGYAIKNPADAYAVAHEKYNKGEYSDQSLSKAFNHWLANDAVAAFNELSNSKLPDADIEKIIVDSYATMLQSDIKFALDLLQKPQLSTISKDSLSVSAVAYLIRNGDFAKGIQIASRIQDRVMRTDIVEEAGLIAARQSSSNFKEFLSRESEYHDPFILGAIRHFSNDPLQYSKIPEFVNMINNADARHQLLKQWYNTSSDDASMTNLILNAQAKWALDNPELHAQISQQ
jgi:hypothetical protein